MQRTKLTYILPILILFIVGCNQTKYVPESQYLVHKNKIKIKGDKLDKDDIASIVRQPANYKRLWIKWKLYAYNTFDSTKIADKRARKDIEIKLENEERLEKQIRINKKRIAKAKMLNTAAIRARF